MTKITCFLSALALAFFASGCEAPTTPEPKKTQQAESKFVEIDGDNLVPVFVASVSNPDDRFLHRMLLKTDSEYSRANKFEQQDTFAAKKARLLKRASAVKGKIGLLRLTGPLRAEDYNQEDHSYTLIQGHNFFFDQRAATINPPFHLRLVFDAYPKKLSAPEAMARAISSVNDGWDNVMLLTAVNIVPQPCAELNAFWDGESEMSQFCYLHVTLIDAVVYVKSRQGGMVKVGSMVLTPTHTTTQPSTNIK